MSHDKQHNTTKNREGSSVEMLKDDEALSNNVFKHLISGQYYLWWRVSAFIALAVLLYLTLMPRVPQIVSIAHFDKVAHFLAFAGVTALFRFGFIRIKNRWLLLSMMGLGIAIELIQDAIPGRSFSWLDWVADIGGALFILCLGYLFFEKESDEQSNVKKN